ncbi:MAG: hypothetical protein HDR85_07250 [Bacteroides sp.]|nr:hypothetical protein [Bacteroides sp.]
MKIDSVTRDALEMVIRHKLPFVLFALPGKDSADFYTSIVGPSGCSPALDNDTDDCFFINFFDNDEPYTATVPFRYTAAEILKMFHPTWWNQPNPEIRPRVSATYRASYHDAFSHIIPRLKADGGKVVLSRHRTIFASRHLIDIVEEYFSLTDNTFRYLCYTPETGVWLGSTPELLLESDRSGREVRTMALAGTRPADVTGPWDGKNIYEQSLVTEFIAETLKKEGLDVKVGELSDKRFVNIRHLCTEITARGDIDVPALLSELSPTPAVAGYPREEALEDISRYESHRRLCYGGYVGVRIDGSYKAYVNLRCCFMAPGALEERYFGWLCNLYAGGGIVAESKEEEEWDETTAKTDALAKILFGSDKDSPFEGAVLNPRKIDIIDGMYI